MTDLERANASPNAWMLSLGFTARQVLDQDKDETGRRLQRARAAGAGVAEIAGRLGLSRGRVSALIERAERRQRWRIPSPLEAYCIAEPEAVAGARRGVLGPFAAGPTPDARPCA